MSVSGPIRDVGWVAVVAGLFPPVLSSLVHPGQELIPSVWCSSDAATVLCNNYLMCWCCWREQQDKGISLNLMPLDKAALRGSGTRYVPRAPHAEASGNQEPLNRTQWSYPSIPPAKGSEAEPDLCTLGEMPQLCMLSTSPHWGHHQQVGSASCPPAAGLRGHSGGCAHLPLALEPKGFQRIWKIFFCFSIRLCLQAESARCVNLFFRELP